MAKPPSVFIIYADNPKDSDPQELSPVADGSYGTWGQWIRDNGISLANTSSNRPPNTMYRDRDGRKFSLHCSACYILGCEASELHKAPTRSWSSWEENFISGHKHSSTQKHSHTKDPETGEWCQCIGTSGSSSVAKKTKRNISIPAKLWIDRKKQNGNFPLQFEIQIPNLHKWPTSQEIDNREYQIVTEAIKTKLQRNGSFSNIVIKESRIICGHIEDLPKTSALLVLGNVQLIDTDAKAIAVSFYDPKKLNLLVWQNDSSNRLIPITLDSGISTDSVKITMVGSNYYVWENHPAFVNNSSLRAITKSKKSRLLPGNPLNSFAVSMTKNETQEYCKTAFNSQGFTTVEFPSPEIDVQVFDLGSKLDGVNALLFVSSKSLKKESVYLEFRRHGGTNMIFGNNNVVFGKSSNSNRTSKFQSGLQHMFDWKKQVLKDLTIESRQRKIIPLEISGTGHLTARVNGVLILDKYIAGVDSKILEIKQTNLDFNIFQKLIPKIMSKSSISGFDDYAGLPDNNNNVEE